MAATIAVMITPHLLIMLIMPAHPINVQGLLLCKLEFVGITFKPYLFMMHTINSLLGGYLQASSSAQPAAICGRGSRRRWAASSLVQNADSTH